MTDIPTAPTTFPSPFNGTGQRMLHPRIAIWSHLKNDYQVYQVNREAWPTIHLIPVTTERTNPFCFAEGPGCRQSRTFTLYRPRARLHSHVDMAIWHTGGWLCRKTHTDYDARLVPVLPILAVSDSTKLQWTTNVGLHKTRDYEDWLQFQSPTFYRSIVHNRMPMVPEATQAMQATQDKLPLLPTSIPMFVAEALLERAEASGETCAIVMEPLQKGTTSATSCYHLFQRDALDTWMTTHDSCPVCKTTCSVTYC